MICRRYRRNGCSCAGLRLDDAEDLFAYASDPKVTATLVWETHLSIDDSVAFLQQVIASYAEDAGAVWGIEDNESGRIIGTISFNTIRGEGYIGDVGYALARPYWGRGLMTEALAAVLDYGFRHVGLHRSRRHAGTPTSVHTG
ncbi:MAG: GNAT family N-acetyltransferase [Thermomicrobiales bacterium]